MLAANAECLPSPPAQGPPGHPLAAEGTLPAHGSQLPLEAGTARVLGSCLPRVIPPFTVDVIGAKLRPFTSVGTTLRTIPAPELPQNELKLHSAVSLAGIQLLSLETATSPPRCTTVVPKSLCQSLRPETQAKILFQSKLFKLFMRLENFSHNQYEEKYQ